MAGPNFFIRLTHKNFLCTQGTVNKQNYDCVYQLLRLNTYVNVYVPILDSLT